MRALFLSGGDFRDLPSPVQPVVDANREGVLKHAHEA